MTHSNDWNEQFQANLEAMRQRMDQMQQQADEEHVRRQQEFENQMQLNAAFRTRQELQSQQIDGLIEVAEITLNSVQQLRDEFRQHRSDNHGT